MITSMIEQKDFMTRIEVYTPDEQNYYWRLINSYGEIWRSSYMDQERPSKSARLALEKARDKLSKRHVVVAVTYVDSKDVCKQVWPKGLDSVFSRF